MNDTRSRHLGYLLGQFGDDRIDHVTFWRLMNQHGYTQADIDAWCDAFHASSSEQMPVTSKREVRRR
jgi:hypothetical protein